MLERLCALVVPRLGRPARVRLLSEDGQWLHPVATAHARPPLAPGASRRLATEPCALTEGLPATVLRNGQPRPLHPRGLARLQQRLRRDTPAPCLAAELTRPPDLLVLPLRARRPHPGHPRRSPAGRTPPLREDRAAARSRSWRTGPRWRWTWRAPTRPSAAPGTRREVAAKRILRMQRVTVALSEALTPADVAGVRARGDGSPRSAPSRAVAVAPRGRPALAGDARPAAACPPGTWRAGAASPARAPCPSPQAYRTGEPVWLESREESPRSRRCQGRRARAVAGLPLLHARAPGGRHRLGLRSPRRFSPDERAFLLDLARQSGPGAGARLALRTAEQRRAPAPSAWPRAPPASRPSTPPCPRCSPPRAWRRSSWTRPWRPWARAAGGPVAGGGLRYPGAAGAQRGATRRSVDRCRGLP